MSVTKDEKKSGMARLYLLLAVFPVSVAVLSPSAYADCLPTPTPTATPAPVVTPDTSRQSASITAGLIADRVASVVNSIGAGAGPLTTGGLNAACDPTLTESALDPVDQAISRALGVSAGNAPETAGRAGHNAVWTGGSYTRVKKTDAGGEYSGSVKNGIAGYDRFITDRLLLGIATGYETVGVNTHYNDGTLDSDSVSLSPYIGYIINDWLSVDASLGHTWIDYDFRSGTTEGETNAGRWFGSANLNAIHRIDSFSLRGSVGYLRLYEEQDAYLDSANTRVEKVQINFGQIRTTVGGAYEIATSFGSISPNAFVRVEYDLPATKEVSLGNGLISSADRTGAIFGLGVDANIGNDLLINLTATTTEFRENTDAYSLVGNVRYSF